ncbi:MAG: di-heme oxidoredictase family protein [bacterium]
MLQRTRRFVFVAVAALGVGAFGAGCGDLLTQEPSPGDLFDAPFDDLPPALNAAFVEGDENFGRTFIPHDGLGPIFNQPSCAACHSGDGRGTPREALVRFSRGGDLAFGEGGPQLQDKAIPGVPVERLPEGVETSTRLPPPVFGMGLIEAIPEDVILALADPDDADGDGISGRPNLVYAETYVPASEIGGGDGLQLGRFGRKASVSSLLNQVVAAYHQDMGVTSDFLPVENPHPQAGAVALGDQVADPEIPASDVLETVVYMRLVAPPRRGPITPRVAAGEAAFTQIGCAKCHVPVLETGPNDIAALSEKPVELYSDLLLHDMGEALADNRADGEATGREWRTAPLWGTRLVRDFLDGQAFFLHDGRAVTLDEAIRLHGGEAAGARDAYAAMDADARANLIAFLESL